MRIHPIFPRPALALALAGALFGLAPQAASQRLADRVGDPVPYRVSLPVSAHVTEENGLLVAQSGHFAVLVATQDMVAGQDEPLPVSEAEARRLMDDMVMGSDSLLLELLHASVRAQNSALNDVMTEMRTLGGQRSGYLRGWTECSCGHTVQVEMHATVKDGIVYLLMFSTHGEEAGEHEALAARILDSFELADEPEPAAPGRRAVIRRLGSSS